MARAGKAMTVYIEFLVTVNNLQMKTDETENFEQRRLVNDFFTCTNAIRTAVTCHHLRHISVRPTIDDYSRLIFSSSNIGLPWPLHRHQAMRLNSNALRRVRVVTSNAPSPKTVYRAHVENRRRRATALLDGIGAAR